VRRRVPWAALALVGSATASLAASGCASTLEHRAREAAESGIDPAPLVAELQAQFEATVNMNGEQSTRTITVLYDLAMNGDKLEGTITNRSGDMDMPARPFSAWREKASK